MDGVGGLIREWRERRRLTQLELALDGDTDLLALIDEIDSYPAPHPEPAGEAGDVLGPLKVRAPGGGELSFFGMFATFDTPFEVTTSELAIELLFPADHATTEALRRI